MERDSEAWVMAARGAPQPGTSWRVDRRITSVGDIGVRSPMADWELELDLVETSDEHPHGGRHQLVLLSATAFALGAVVRLPDAAGVPSPGLLNAIEVLNDWVPSDVGDPHAVDVVYIESVQVNEAVRGHGWEYTALANLIDGVGTPNSVVVAHEPVGEASSDAASRAVHEFGAQRLSDSRLWWFHLSDGAAYKQLEQWIWGPT